MRFGHVHVHATERDCKTKAMRLVDGREDTYRCPQRVFSDSVAENGYVEVKDYFGRTPN